MMCVMRENDKNNDKLNNSTILNLIKILAFSYTPIPAVIVLI